jgi:hypothetical protein
MPLPRARALLQRLHASYEGERERASRDRLLLARLRVEGGAPLVGIPRLEGDLSDVEGLARLIALAEPA